MEQENIFQGKRVKLRSPEPTDAPIHFEMDNTYTNMARHNYFIHFPGSLVQAQNWSQQSAEKGDNNHAYTFNIEAVASGELVGGMNTFNCNMQNGTFSYGLGIFPPYQRHGYASESIILLLRYFFMELRYQKVTAQVYAFNDGSLKLHEKLGFQQEGHLRRMFYSAGQYHDMVVLGMLAEEFQEIHAEYWQANQI